MVSPAQLAEWVSGQWTRHPEAPIAGVCHDTRTLKPGDVHIALRGMCTTDTALFRRRYRPGQVHCSLTKHRLR